MAQFKAQKILSVSVGKIEFKQSVGILLDEMQPTFRNDLVERGYSEDQAEKIVDAVLGQVFGFLTGPAPREDGDDSAPKGPGRPPKAAKVEQ